MPYSKRYAGGFVDKPSLSTAIDATFLNAVEAALLALFGVAPATNGALVWNGTQFTAANKLTNANIDATAAIAKSKLDLAGQIVDADIAGAAAISQSKINGLPAALASAGDISIGTALPGLPVDKDKFILVDNTGTPTYAWMMQYVAAAAKWLFIGGSELIVQNAGPNTTTSTVYVDSSGMPSLVTPRAGVYIVEFGARITGNNSGATTIRTGWVAPKIGAAATSDNDAVVSADSNGGTYNSNVTVSRKLSKTFAAGDTCKLQIRVDSAASQMAWWNAWLSIRPVAVV